MSEDQQLTLNEVAESNAGPKAAHIENSAFGNIPDDWTWEKTGEHLKYIQSGISESQNKDGEGIPVSRIETIANGIVNYQKVGYVNGDKDYSKHRLEPGDLLFSNINSRAEIGKTAIYRGEQPLYHGMNLLRLRYDSNTFNPYFAYYIYDSPMAQDVFFRMSKAAVGQSSINQSQMERLFLPTPPFPEQRKIATVLYTVDQAIEKTKKIISKTKRVRRGLAQDIFREGLHTDETKETWLGKIPASWSVVQFSEIVDSNRNGLYKSKDAYGHGSPIAKMGNALENRVLDMSSADRLELTEKEKEKYGLEQGDLIFARRAQEVSAAGDCCYVPELDELTVFTSSLIRVRLKEDMSPKFYVQYFDGPVGSRSIDRITTETSISGIATSDLLDLKVAVPDIKEQNEIASILWGFDEQIWSLQREIGQYKRLKKGLMQDLLSGKVRTTDTNITVPDEVAQYG